MHKLAIRKHIINAKWFSMVEWDYCAEARSLATPHSLLKSPTHLFFTILSIYLLTSHLRW